MWRVRTAALAARTATLAASLAVAAGQAPQLLLAPCSTQRTTSQAWFFDASNTTMVLSSDGYCIDILQYGITPGSEVYTAPCHHDDHDPTHQNQEWSIPAASPAAAQPLLAAMSGLPIGVAAGFAALPGSPLTLVTNGTGLSLYLNASTGQLIDAGSGLCVDAGGGIPTPGPAPNLRACAAGRALTQLFKIAPGGGYVQLASPRLQDNATVCLTAAGDAGGSGVVTASCTPGAGGAAPSSQSFALTGGRLVSAVGDGALVVDAGASDFYEAKAVGLSAAPSAASAWTFNASTVDIDGSGVGMLVQAATGYCLDAAPPPTGHGCLDATSRTLPFCNADLPLADRVGDLLSRLTLDEKIGLTGSGNWNNGASSCDTIDPGVARLGIPPTQWLVETNSMAASQCYGQVCATAFPSSANLAASFNRTLWREKGRVVSDEMRALNSLSWHRADNTGYTSLGLNGFGPDVNNPRDPRNGRAGELPTEDPHLSGSYAVEYVTGMQQGPDPRYMKMSAGIKHFAGYSLETGRFGSIGNFSAFDLWDTYLRPFEMAFTAGGVAGSMCAYISLRTTGSDGQATSTYVPACANEYLMQTVTREYWGRADAYHLSDCGAVANMADTGIHYAANYTYAAAYAMNAGMDINSETTVPDNLGLALQLGLTQEIVLDTSLTRTLALRFETGMLDDIDSQPYAHMDLSNLGTAGNQAVAYEGAATGLVLVKNDGASLPLSTGKRVAVLGPLSNTSYALMGDYYADSVCPGFTDYTKAGYDCVPTLANAIQAVNTGGTTVSFDGVSMLFNDSSWSDALAAAASADAVVLCLGTDQTIAHEGVDLLDIGLPGLQTAFGQAVMSAVKPGTPVVLLLISSFPTSFDELAGSVPAIVLGYTPSFGAPAVAAALFGTNRWGRSVYTVYPHAYQQTVDLFDFSMTPSNGSSGAPSNAGRTYRYYDGSSGEPLVKFGQGLTYSTVAVACTCAAGCSPAASVDTNVTLTCTISPKAGPAGDQVLLAFHRVGADVQAAVAGTHPIPLSSLVGFERAAVPAAGGSPVAVSISLPVNEAFVLRNATGASLLYAGMHFIDVWDGGANNITIAIDVTAGGAASVAVAVPPLPW